MDDLAKYIFDEMIVNEKIRKELIKEMAKPNPFKGLGKTIDLELPKNADLHR